MVIVVGEPIDGYYLPVKFLDGRQQGKTGIVSPDSLKPMP
jgi:hypothetical protein